MLAGLHSVAYLTWKSTISVSYSNESGHIKHPHTCSPLHPCEAELLCWVMCKSAGNVLSSTMYFCSDCLEKIFKGEGAGRGGSEIVQTLGPKKSNFMALEEVLSYKVCSWWLCVGDKLILIWLAPCCKHDLGSLLALILIITLLVLLWAPWVELRTWFWQKESSEPHLPSIPAFAQQYCVK